MKNSEECNCNEMLTAIKMYLDENGFETQIYGTCLSVKDPSSSQFVMVGQSPTKISVCYDEDIIDVADPDSLPFIARIVKYCKESKGTYGRCSMCPLETKRKCRTTLQTD